MVEAAAWLAGLELGTANLDAFQQWRAADPRHALAFARVYASAESVSALAQPDQPDVGPLDETVSRRRFLRAAVAGTVLAVGGSTVFATRAFAWSNARTAVGEFRKVSLPDGSIVALNTDSAVSWRYDAARRLIRLDQGEIALDLRPGMPARLSGSGTEASLSAGRFVARLGVGTVDLMVLKGRALVSKRGGAAPLPVAAHQEATLSAAAPRITPTSEDRISKATAWQNGEIEFDDEPLAAAVAEYNRYLTRKIVIDDPALAGLRIGGRFSSADPDSFLQALALSLDLRVQEGRAAVHIQPRK